VFGTVCTPENPIGSCMVSSEGACAAHYTYGRYRVGSDPGKVGSDSTFGKVGSDSTFRDRNPGR